MLQLYYHNFAKIGYFTFKDVNAKKTKILIFQKKCRKSTYEKQHL